MKSNFKRIVLENGLTLLFEKRDLPVVSMAYMVKQGGINESIEEKGISHFIEHMLYKGTPTRDTKKIATEIERNGGELNGFTSEEITCYWCKMPSETAQIGLEVLTDMVKNPLFDQEEIEKERQVIFEEMKMRRDNPRVHVYDEIQSFLYGGPLASNLIGTKETMNSLDREKLKDLFEKTYSPSNMVLCVVGDYDFEKLKDFANNNFEKKEFELKKQEITLKNEIKTETRKGLDQANVALAFHTPLASEDKSYAAKVLTTLMGGGLSSRLFLEIREKKNLAYSVKGEAAISKDYSYCLIYVGTTKENVEKVKQLILEEFEKDITQEELDEVKKQLIGNYEIEMEDSQNQMVNLVMAEYENNAEDFYEYKKKLNK